MRPHLSVDRGLPRDSPKIEGGGRDLEAFQNVGFSKGFAGVWFFTPPFKCKMQGYLDGLVKLLLEHP